MLFINPLLNEFDISGPKKRKTIKHNKYLERSTEITICKRKKRRARQKLTPIKRGEGLEVPLRKQY